MTVEKPDTIDRITGMGAADLTSKAQSGQLSRAYGRDAEVEKVLSALARHRSVLLLGASEVGKTAILHEATQRMIRGSQAPEAVRNKWVVGVSTGIVLAGTRYIGEWQTRLTELLDSVVDGRTVYLYIEDIWGLRDAGRASDERDGFSTLVRAYLERGHLQLLAEVTPEFYNTSPRSSYALINDHSLLKHFDIIQVEEPTPEATRSILASVARGLRHGGTVRIETSAIDRAIELTRRYLPYQAFPGKATRLLTEAAQPPDTTGSSNHAQPAERLVTSDVVNTTFSRMTGLPEKIISDAIGLRHEDIRAYFDERVIGQTEAVKTVADIVTLIKAEMTDPTRPLGVLFFVGPTGVGKTELAKTLAEYLFGNKDKLIRLDMSEFKSPFSEANLLSQLTEKQRRQSFAVLLLDEVEKANPAVFDLFLQVFGDGRLTDSSGRSVDLRNTIIIMTSNIGTHIEDTHSIGFVNPGARAEERTRQVLKEVEEYFRPEFINRLDKIIVFQPLGRDEMRRIARRELGRALVREGVLRRNILIDFREDVLDVLLQEGFSPAFGARPLQRAIRDLVILPLARTIAEQPALGEQLLELGVRDGVIVAEPIALTTPAVAVEQDESPREKTTITEGESGRTRTMDIRELQKLVEGLRARVEAHINSERYEALRETAQALLEEMGRPSFWDDTERSRQVMSEAHHVDRITKRFTDLRERIDGMLEAAKMIRRNNDSAGLARLATSYEQVDGELTLAEMELLAGAADASVAQDVFLCITPLPSPRGAKPDEHDGWPDQLRDMYLAWATRKGYDAEAINDGGDPVIALRGPSLARMLRGEEGVHKLQREEAQAEPKKNGHPGTRVYLARVEILPAPDHASGIESGFTLHPIEERRASRGQDGRHVQIVEATDEAHGVNIRVRGEDAERLALALLRALTAREPATTATADDIVRIYNQGRTQFVRDRRTNERDGQIARVFAGALDRFLLAFLRSSR
ncbi:MAG TPA: AAA family ATPase [Ktedonobacterales bacterium]|jgi:ATP-dependent Clp protease ATP-binding subunit ClpC